MNLARCNGHAIAFASLLVLQACGGGSGGGDTVSPPPAQMGYLFLQSLVPTVPASFLTFAEAPVYRVYEEFPRITGLSVVADQQFAGGIMKVGGGLILWAAIAVIFFRWFGQDDTSRHRRRAATSAVVAAELPGTARAGVDA